MAMSRPQPVNVVLVAATSAALHGGAAVLFVPTLSFLMLCWSGEPVPRGSTETGMVLAVLAPVAATIFGFAAGAGMAMAHNIFAHGQRKLSIQKAEAEAPSSARVAAFSNVA